MMTLVQDGLTNSMDTTLCKYCLQGYPWECEYPDEDGYASCIATPVVKVDRLGPVKDNEDVTDLESTGRKRAAQLYPLKEGMICEWANLKYAGGGVVSVVGCNGNLATNRHHGPDKNTLNNEVGNVHRICASCHNRYHSANDSFYNGDRPSGSIPWLPSGTLIAHDTETKASPQEIIESELKWRTQKKGH